MDVPGDGGRGYREKTLYLLGGDPLACLQDLVQLLLAICKCWHRRYAFTRDNRTQPTFKNVLAYLDYIPPGRNNHLLLLGLISGQQWELPWIKKRLEREAGSARGGGPDGSRCLPEIIGVIFAIISLWEFILDYNWRTSWIIAIFKKQIPIFLLRYAGGYGSCVRWE
jgi:hypothetical protein